MEVLTRLTTRRLPAMRNLLPRGALLFMAIVMTGPAVLAADKMAPQEGTDDQIESLTMDVLRLQRDWLELREWPSESPERRIEVYLTTSLADQANVHAVTLSLDNQAPIRHSYKPAQVEALRNGGAHRLLLGALEPGTYLLKASVVGWDGLQRTYQAETRLALRKQQTSKLIELHLVSLQPGERPEIVVRQWD